MSKKSRDRDTEKKKSLLDSQSEIKTNRDNVVCLIVLAAVLLLCELLNEIRLFKVVPQVMRICAACGVVCYLVPVAVLWRPLRLFKEDPRNAEYAVWHKYFILLCVWLGTIAECVTLTHQTILAMAVPILIMAQYRNTRDLVPLTSILATICVFLGVYGGFFWGCFDGNLLHLAITDANEFDLALRIELATPTRMTELLTHYVLPRVIIVHALILLATKISHRSDEMLMRQAQLQSAVEREMQRTNEMQRQIIYGMANLIENRDNSTGEHVKRTGYYVKSLVRQLQSDPKYSGELSAGRADTIISAAPLHDIGKIVVADRILQKPGKLTAEEYEEIKLHAAEGVRVIDNVLGGAEDEAFLRAAKEISGSHHERWDGKGYPNGLSGEQIPLSARIMAVADVFDALVSERVYKQPIPPEEAFAIIIGEAGAQFDPEVVKAFVALKPRIMAYLSANIMTAEETESPLEMQQEILADELNAVKA